MMALRNFYLKIFKKLFKLWLKSYSIQNVLTFIIFKELYLKINQVMFKILTIFRQKRLKSLGPIF